MSIGFSRYSIFLAHVHVRLTTAIQKTKPAYIVLKQRVFSGSPRGWDTSHGTSLKGIL